MSSASIAFSPHRLSLPLSPVEENLDSEGQREWSWDIASGHGYLHSLAVGREDWTGKERDSGLGIVLPSSTRGSVKRGRDSAHVRSYSEPLVANLVRTMAMARVVEVSTAEEETDTAPSSPPELSSSKSSKSSLRSDSSDEDDVTEKSSPLTEVFVAESIEDSNLKPESRPTLKRPARSTHASSRSVTSPIDPRPNALPRGLGLRIRPGAGFRSPSMPVLNTDFHQDSRSPSPTSSFTRNGISMSPQYLASPITFHHTSARSPSSLAVPRRKSWQSTAGAPRKSTKELEAEDKDEVVEVPDDFILENVPISPMPGQTHRLSQSLSRPQSRPESRSATPSPQRRPSYTNLHSARVPKNAKRPSAPTILPNGQYGAPRSPRSSRPHTLQHSYTVSAFPPHKQRSKSWTDDLNAEARQLSEALETYEAKVILERHGGGEKPHSENNSSSSSPREPGFLKHRAQTSLFDLPTLSTGSVMIDPLPISKEKEAVLARTRPSWLPPKDQKEDRRHVKEWEQMMACAAEKEKQRALKRRENQETSAETKENLARLWDQHVLPNWDTVIKEPKTRELWWRGVTPRNRGVVWQKAIGNDLELTELTFTTALQRASTLASTIEKMTPEERADSREAAWFNAIARDIQTTSLDLPSTSPKRPAFQTALRDVLSAYAIYRADVGYVYGTHLPAGLLCRHLPPAKAFIALANLLNRPLPLAFLIHDPAAMAGTYELVLRTLRYKSPALHAHLTSPALNLRPEEFLDPMFRCLFARNLSVECVARVWDVWVFEGDKVLVRAAVACLGRLERKLYGSREEILAVVGWGAEGTWDVGGEEGFMGAVREAGKVDAGGLK